MSKKKESESTELARGQQNALAPAPDYIEDSREGFENMTAADLVFPRAVLMQALSPQVQDTEEFSSGDIVNSVSNTLIAAREQVRTIVPLKFWHEWIEWRPRSEGGGMGERSTDPNSELAKIAHAGTKVKDGEKTVQKVTEYLVFLVLPIDEQQMPDPANMFCVCCAKTNYRHGRKLLTLARMRGNKPLYAGAYTFNAAKQTNKKVGADYYVFNFANNGWAPQEIYEALKRMYDQYRDQNVVAAAPQSDGESEPDGDVGDAAEKAGI